MACTTSSALSCTGTVTRVCKSSGPDSSVHLSVPGGSPCRQAVPDHLSAHPRGSAVAHGPSCLGRRRPGASLAPLLHLRSEWDLGSLQGLAGTGSRVAAEPSPPVFSGSGLQLSLTRPNLCVLPTFRRRPRSPQVQAVPEDCLYGMWPPVSPECRDDKPTTDSRFLRAHLSPTNT